MITKSVAEALARPDVQRGLSIMSCNALASMHRSGRVRDEAEARLVSMGVNTSNFTDVDTLDREILEILEKTGRKIDLEKEKWERGRFENSWFGKTVIWVLKHIVK